MGKYTFLPEVILRTPAYSFSPEINALMVKKALEDSSFLEALYLASPSLYDAALDLENLQAKHQKKVLISLAKYILRSRTRPTPFGLFSEAGIVKWGQKTQVKRLSSHRKSRVAYESLQPLIEKLPLNNIKLIPNGTIYHLPEELRYIEVGEENGKTAFEISAIQKNEVILFVLGKTKEGLSFDKLVSALVKEGIPQEEGSIFINNLIELQVLVNSKSLPVIKNTPLSYLIHEVKEGNQSLLALEQELNALDQSFKNKRSAYSHLKSILGSEQDLRFHVNRFSNFGESTIDQNNQTQILEALNLLNSINPEEPGRALNAFKTQFRRRFGNQKVPLLLALDTEMGVGYLNTSQAGSSPLIEDISFGHDREIESSLELNRNQKILQKALMQSLTTGEPICLENLKLNTSQAEINLSQSSSVIFRVTSKNQIYLEGCSGSSAVNVYSRFTSDSEVLEKLALRTIRFEKDKNPNVIFAEIVHLPESYLGDILGRKVTHEHQIPILSQVQNGNPIALQDLTLSLFEDSLVLKSMSLQKEVIPRLSNTHNFANSTLPVYRFLADLQFQTVAKKITFDWGSLKKNKPFLPRVIHKDIIVSLATWQLSSEQILALKSVNDFYQLQDAMALPQYFNVIEGDNELFIDTKNQFLLDLFLDHIRGEKDITLKEFILSSSVPIKDYNGSPLSNQFVASLVKQEPVFISRADPEKTYLNYQESITPLKEKWQYLKVFCGNTSVDTILGSHISPLLERLYSFGIIQKWFFIRYSEPDFHIRLRFKLSSLKSLEAFWLEMNEIILVLRDKELIWKTSTHSYVPEKNRYQAFGLRTTEQLFQIDSEAYFALLKNREADDSKNLGWLFALKSIDQSLTFFGLELKEKLKFIQRLRDTFVLEFGIDQSKKKELDKKYRQFRNEIESVITRKPSTIEKTLNHKKEFLLRMSFTKWKMPLNETQKIGLAGMVHMTVNRAMTSNARLHELFIYDFLFRQYKSQLARVA